MAETLRGWRFYGLVGFTLLVVGGAGVCSYVYDPDAIHVVRWFDTSRVGGIAEELTSTSAGDRTHNRRTVLLEDQPEAEGAFPQDGRRQHRHAIPSAKAALAEERKAEAEVKEAAVEIMLEVKEASLKTIAAEAVDGAGSTETTSQEEAIVERVEDEAVEESAEEAIQDLREGAHGEMSEVQINKMHHAIKHELKAKFKERELMLEEKLKAAPLPASEGTEGGWIKAMFDTMDEDNDGMITVDQLKEFATSMQLPDNYIDGFVRVADHDSDALVSFHDFITTIRAREMALNHACQPFETETGKGVWVEAVGRGQWLLGLMVVQSLSGIVLQNFEKLIQNHMVVTFFLTMLVGAGGNAGNQSTIKVIEGLAAGEIVGTWESFMANMTNQLAVGMLLAVIMFFAGFVRVLVTNGLTKLGGGVDGWELKPMGLQNCFAISSSLFLIVVISCVMGTFLPFFFMAMSIEPANAGPTMQVLMDIIGVIITCAICEFVLNTHNLKARVLALLGLQPLPSAVVDKLSPVETARWEDSTDPLHNVGAPATL